MEADLLYAKPGADTAVLATAVFSASCAPAMGALPPTGMTAAAVAVAAPPSMFCTADFAGGGGGLRRAVGFLVGLFVGFLVGLLVGLRVGLLVGRRRSRDAAEAAPRVVSERGLRVGRLVGRLAARSDRWGDSWAGAACSQVVICLCDLCVTGWSKVCRAQLARPKRPCLTRCYNAPRWRVALQAGNVS